MEEAHLSMTKRAKELSFSLLLKSRMLLSANVRREKGRGRRMSGCLVPQLRDVLLHITFLKLVELIAEIIAYARMFTKFIEIRDCDPRIEEHGLEESEQGANIGVG